jgi:hypothetical protein
VPAALRVAALALLAAATAACGAGRHAEGSRGATTVATPAAQRAEVAHVWTTFFAGSTVASRKEALLQNGSAFADVIKAQAGSPLAKQTTAKVVRVELRGPTTATVVYTIELSGRPVLRNRRGTAVKIDGGWRVGQESFCGLLTLQAAAPPACEHAQ